MRGGTQIGYDGENYTVTRLGGGTADELCTVVAVLAAGQIDLAGLVTSTPQGPGTFQVAVTGGTGSYARRRRLRHRGFRAAAAGHHPPHRVTCPQSAIFAVRDHDLRGAPAPPKS